MRTPNFVFTLILLCVLLSTILGIVYSEQGLASLPAPACSLFCPIGDYVKVKYVDMNLTLPGSQRVAEIGVGEQFEFYVEVWLKRTSSEAPMALIAVASWADEYPPPNRAYVKIYEGIPSPSGSTYRLTGKLRAPNKPGNYSLWIVYVPPPLDPELDPLENFFRIWRDNLSRMSLEEAPNCGPPHAKIRVLARPKITYTNFWISKHQVKPGEEIQFGVTVLNQGNAEGKYEIEAKLDGAHLETKSGLIGPGQVIDLVWTLTLNEPGDHWIDLGRFFSTTVHVLEPGDVNVTKLRASSSEITPGEEVKVYVTVSNNGELERDIRLVLKVDGKAVDEKVVIVQPMSSKDIEFSLNLTKPGVHKIEVGELGPLEIRVLKPGECVVSGVHILNSTVTAGDVVNVTVEVSNVGDIETSCFVELTVNNTKAAFDSIKVPGGMTKNLSLSFMTWNPGTYLLSVNGTEVLVEALPPEKEAPEQKSRSGLLTPLIGASVAALALAGYFAYKKQAPSRRRSLASRSGRKRGRSRTGLKSVKFQRKRRRSLGRGKGESE